MPKVNDEYIYKKKEQILNSLETVFQRKSLVDINMMDIIKEAGLSKGGIYRYYKDVDEIIIEMINDITNKYYLKNNFVQKIAYNSVDENNIIEIFKVLGTNIENSVSTLGKIQFELTILQVSNPERAEKILSGLTEYNNGRNLIGKLHFQIEKGIEIGLYKPSIKLEEIYDYIKVNIEGIVKVVVFEKCYEHKEKIIDVKKMMNMLASTVVNMLKNNF